MGRAIEPWMAGVIIGVAAVLAGTIGGLYPPEAYGLCTTCHGRDLMLGLIRPLSPGAFDLPVIWPALTTVGVIAGSFIARRAAAEPRRRDRIDTPMAVTRVAQGFVVMSFALLAMGCPIRLTISAATLAVQAFIALAGVALGIWIGVQYLKARA
jgi:uncharacterized protein YneF (UPF0154 family)